MQHLVFVIPSLGCGGSEQVVSWLASCYAAIGVEVAIVALDGLREQPFFELHPLVKLVGIPVVEAPVGGLLALRRYLGKVKPDVVVGFVGGANLCALIATIGLRVPVVVSEQDHPAFLKGGLFRSIMRSWLYPRAARIVLLSESFATAYGRSQKQLVVIPNSVRPLKMPMMPKENIIVAAGRLIPKKGFDLFIDALIHARERLIGWRFVIAGDGPDRDALQLRAKRGGIEVDFVGTVSSVEAIFQRAKIFALTSRYEGFPLVLLEAMSCGCTPVLFDSPGAMRDMVVDGASGVFVSSGDVEGFGRALGDLSHDDARWQRMSRAAALIGEKFPESKVFALWEKLFLDVGRGT